MTKHISRRTALRGIATIAATGGATAALAAPEAPDGLPPAAAVLKPELDAELIHLGRQLDDAFARERALIACHGSNLSDEAGAAFEAAFETCGALAGGIDAIPARTLAGLRVKALAVQWCYGDDLPLDDRDATTDIRLAGSIVRDLLAMGGVA